MHAPAPQILIQRMAEIHIEGVTALYNEPAVCRQVLQMPFQSIEVWRKRLAASTERHVKLVALSGGEVIGSLGLEQYSRSRQSHVGAIGMGVASAWHGKGIGSKLLAAALDIADNWMNMHRVELTVLPTMRQHKAFIASTVSNRKDACATTPCAMAYSSMP